MGFQTNFYNQKGSELIWKRSGSLGSSPLSYQVYDGGYASVGVNISKTGSIEVSVFCDSECRLSYSRDSSSGSWKGSTTAANSSKEYGFSVPTNPSGYECGDLLISEVGGSNRAARVQYHLNSDSASQYSVHVVVYR